MDKNKIQLQHSLQSISDSMLNIFNNLKEKLMALFIADYLCFENKTFRRLSYIYNTTKNKRIRKKVYKRMQKIIMLG